MPSDGQPQEALPPVIGPSSTESAQDSAQPVNLTEAEDRLADQLEYDEGVRRLLRMTAVESLAEDLKLERDAVKYDLKHSSVWGVDQSSTEENPLADDEMKVMAGGNVTVHINKPEPAQEKKAEQSPVEAAVKAAGTGLSLATALALGGPVGLGLAAIPVVGSLMQKPAVVQPAEKPIGNLLQDYDLYVGPPKG